MKGQSLLEVLAALGAGVIVLTAITVAVITSLSNAQFSKNQNIATQYAQEGMELLRKMRDSDWAAFSFLSGSYCLDKGDTLLNIADRRNTTYAGCVKGNPPSPEPVNVSPIFVRQVDIQFVAIISEDDPPCEGNMKGTVGVSWASGKCTSGTFCHTVSLVSCFSNYYVAPTP